MARPQIRLYSVTEEHSNVLQKNIQTFFRRSFGCSVEDLDWVRDPFGAVGTSRPLRAQEELIDILFTDHELIPAGCKCP
jgi:hypothetical protein